MAEHYLTVIGDGEVNYQFRVDGSVEPVTTGISVLQTEDDIFDNITQQADGTILVEGQTGLIVPSGVEQWFGDTYRFTGSILEANVSVSAGTDWAYLLDGKQVSRSELLAVSDGEEPDGDGEPEPSGNWIEENPLIAGLLIGLVTQAILRAIGGD